MPRPRFFVLLLCLAPLAGLIAAVAVYGVDVLRWDEWMVYGRMLERLDTGTFDLNSLIAQQNEQRLASARIFGLAFISLADLNRYVEFGFNIFLAGLLLVLVSVLFHRSSRRIGLKATWAYPMFALLAFSLAQWDGFFLGINNTLHVPVLCLASAVLLMDNPRMGPGKFLVLAALCFAGSFHFANGLFLWFCILPMLMAMDTSKRAKMLYTGLWLVPAAGTWILYLANFQLPAHHPSIWSFFDQPLHCILYFFTYLGGPIFAGRESPLPATAMGFWCFLFFVFNAWVLFTKNKETRRFLLPWLCLALFSLLSDGVTSVGRGGFPLSQALESRYVTFSTPFWYSLIALAAAAAMAAKKPLNLIMQSVQRMALIIICISFSCSQLMSVLVLDFRSELHEKGRQELYSLQSARHISRIFPDPDYLMTMLPRFFDHRLTVFRHIKYWDEYQLAEDNGQILAGHLASVVPNPVQLGKKGHAGLLLEGWAQDPATGNPAQWVLIVCQGKIVYASDTGITPPDNASGASEDSGFSLFLPWFFFPDDSPNIEVFAVMDDGVTVRPLQIDVDLPVRIPPRPEPEYTFERFFLST